MIRIENLSKHFGEVCAVNNISLAIARGEIVGLLGPNGAGKTTTLRMMTGYLLPTSGTIHIKEYSMDTETRAGKNVIGYLPEAAPLYHNMLVYDYLDYVASLRGMRKDERLPRLRELADLCGLHGIMHKTIGELSRGLKQRVGLAHAMMSNPEILVLDEPTAGLDPNQIVEIREIIRRIGKEKTVVLSTHILSEAEATCDRIVIIHRGSIVADDRTEMLKKSLGGGQRVSLALRNARPREVIELLQSLEGVHQVDEGDSGDDFLVFTVSARSSDDIRERIYRGIRTTDWVLVEMHQESKPLESIFRELTREA